ncbi:MAG: TrkA family potassium uptake protein [Phycisphaerae bacterium]
MYIVIAGAGLVGTGLAERLIESRHDVVVIDHDRNVCERVAAHLGAMALHGSATNIDILEQAGTSRADVAVGTTQADADNLAFALLAKSFGVPRVIARMRDPRYEAAYKEAGVTTTVHVSDVFVNQLMLDIEEPHLRQLATFGAGKAAIVVDTIPAGAAVSGRNVSEVAAAPEFPNECVITGIYRPETQKFIIPRGSAEVHAGDRVFLVAEHPNLRKASKFLHRKKRCQEPFP